TSNVATVSLNVTAPVAANDAYKARKNVPLTVAAPGVLANDTDAGGFSLTAVLVSGPSHGTLTLNADGSFTYTPATDYTGADSFTYKDSGGGTTSNVATVSLTVAAPTATNDSYGARKNVPLSVAAPGVLANDTDPYGDPLTAVLVSGPSHGTLALSANGSFTYTPATDYTGADSFTYQAVAGGALSNVATASLNVTAPVAVNKSYSTPEEKALSVAAPGVLANDTDAGGFSLTAVLVSGPSHGTLALNADGSFTYTPARAYTGSDSFTYKDSGGGTTSNVATVSLTVTAPTLSINDVRANSSGLATTFTFTVTLSSPISQAVTVAYATADGSAMAPVDYFSTSGTLTFQPGQTSQTIGVMVLAHPLPGPDKTFFVNLSAPSNATLARATGTGTIVSGNLLQLAGPAVAPAPDVQPLTQGQLAPVVAEAEALWSAAGADTVALGGIDIRITDLPGSDLGAEAPGVIWIDVNAAGYGWSADPNPADPVPANRVDLLTVVGHEMGHALGLDHEDSGVMQEELAVGARHPIASDALLGAEAVASAAAVSGPAQPVVASTPPAGGAAAAFPQVAAGDPTLVGPWVGAWLAGSGATAATGGATGNGAQAGGAVPAAVPAGGLTFTGPLGTAPGLSGPAPGAAGEPVVGPAPGAGDAPADPLAGAAAVDQFFAAWADAPADPALRLGMS
ncbi:MAG TPA: Ig-like domain-containing protein, partial [Gemmataceae bacterium]|nr:Ig-like domain-containing protein [Gemmataceae bacterium]